ncbi:hypothetical protein DASB73_018280 [Starmerella bacillaris]|uniref:Autophagy-related protein 14 n=1 Tax=Starmerella bacillaris TaxID=1247836 RepID=A0AAV5RHE7_STABA|nr:hypothetical protein DASB73_018280 [Starmerella bacillaris]
MRLAGITHLGLRSKSVESRRALLVIYIGLQSQPIYISEERLLSPYSITEFNKVDFTNSQFCKEFKIAIQQWVYANKWVQSNEWILDLREFRPASSHIDHSKDDVASPTHNYTNNANQLKHHNVGHNYDTSDEEIVIYSNNTEMAPPPLEQEDLESGFPGSPKPPEPLTSRIFKWYYGNSDNEGGIEGDYITSLSYPQLVDLWTLENSLDQSKVSSKDLKSEADKIIKESLVVLETKRNAFKRKLKLIQSKRDQMQNRTKELLKEVQYINEEYKKIDTMVSESMYVADSLSRVNNLHNSNDNDNDKNDNKNNNNNNESESSLVSNVDYSYEIKREQARLALELLQIFPIEPIDDHKFVFSICGIVLPSVFAINHYDPVQVGAALGFVAQMVVCLSRYLDVPLTYPITLCGSQSYITDNISVIKHGSSQFPLWTRGTLLYRVEYALYLLHKDIEKLMNSVNLAVIDLKQTLANLKNLLLVISSNM